jgi:hypothetical protein
MGDRAEKVRRLGAAQEEDAELGPNVHLAGTEVLDQEDRTDRQILDAGRRPHGLPQALIPSLPNPEGAIGEVPSTIVGVQEQDATVAMHDDRDLGDLVQGFVGHARHPNPPAYAFS